MAVRTIKVWNASASAWEGVGVEAPDFANLIPASVVTAKGDLIAATGSGSVDNLAVGTEGYRLQSASAETTGLKWVADPVTIGVACSDETSALVAASPVVTFRMPHAMTLTNVRASLSASASTLTTVDINQSASSVLSTKLTIDANEFSSTTASVAASISTSALSDDAEITIDIDGAGTGAKGLKVWLIGTRP
jgi:hypothetical protein